LIKEHKWTCDQCDDKLFLRVDDSIEKDIFRLGEFENFVSLHVMKTGHTMTHKEKIDKGFRYV